ncbi:hypothetical protein C5167_007534 [Papaver somniferum]|nr:hypothetical protein C5167_007534 [Papaver somniferum]
MDPEKRILKCWRKLKCQNPKKGPTGFIRILPDAFDDLASPCLQENPRGNFPFTGFLGMVFVTFATGYYTSELKTKLKRDKTELELMNEQTVGEHETEAMHEIEEVLQETHGHSHV